MDLRTGSISLAAIEREHFCCPSSKIEKTMDFSNEKHESMNPHDVSFTQIDCKSNFSFNLIDCKPNFTEKQESMNPSDLSSTQIDSKFDFGDPICRNPTETASLAEQDELDLADHKKFSENSSTEKYESMNPSDLSSTQIDCKLDFSDPTCPDPTETASLIEQDELDLAGHEKFSENSSTEKHESVNPQHFSFTQIDSKANSSNPRCPVPTEIASLIQKDQLDAVHTEFRQLCLPRKPQKVPSVSFIFVSNTYKVADVTLLVPKSRTETSGDRTPAPPNVWQNGTSQRLMRVLGPVCAALFAVYWGWSSLYASEQQ